MKFVWIKIAMGWRYFKQIQLGLLQTDTVVQLHQTAHAENVRMRIAQFCKLHPHYSISRRSINYVQQSASVEQHLHVP